jgi:hypothetical protein
MENHIIDLIKKSLIYFDNQNNKYNKFLKDTEIHLNINNKKILNKITFEEIDNRLNFETEILGIFNHQSNVFLWSWALPYLGINETKISKELLNYGLKLEPNSNTISHFYLKSLLVNARNYIESDFDLELIQAISSYILKDKFSFIYPTNTLNKEKRNIIITTYFLVKISSN